jgi:cytochrome c oxidase cbb3-type subunit 3
MDPITNRIFLDIDLTMERYFTTNTTSSWALEAQRGSQKKKVGRTSEMLKRVRGSIVLGLLFPFFLMSGVVFAEGDPKEGAKFYKSLKCAPCHGKDGKGQGPMSKAMKLKASDWTDKAAMEKITDDFLRDIIIKGGKAVNKSKLMPGYSKKLKPADVANLVAFIRSFAK